MDIAILKSILIWCTIINYAVLLFWFGAIVAAHDSIYRLHNRWFKISMAQYDAIMYGSMAAYKIGILLFNLAPLIALAIVAK